MGRAILSNRHGVVGKDVGGRKLRESCHSDGGTTIVAENEEGGAGDAEDAVVGVAVHDRAHGVLADAEVKIATFVVLAGEVTSPFDVVEGGAKEIGAAAHEERHGLGDWLKDNASSLTRRNGLIRLEGGDEREKIGNLLLDASIQERCQLEVGGAPSGKLFLPSGMRCGTLGLQFSEVSGDLGGDEELLLGETESLAGLVCELHAGLAVRLVGSLDLGDAFADHGAAHDHVRLTLGRLGLVKGSKDFIHVVTVDLLNVPAIGLVTGRNILALAHVEHGVKGHVVGIKEEDQVIKAKVTSQ